MNGRRVVFLIPLLLFVTLTVFFVRRLAMVEEGSAPNLIPSAMIGKPVPNFRLKTLDSKTITAADLKGKVTLINFFASWCLPCRAEHPLLASVKQGGIRLIGINYKDNTDKLHEWLAKLGNPYDAVGIDDDGRAGIDFGVYGVPESYVIDRDGIIRFKQSGPLSQEDIDDKVIPLAMEPSK